MNTFKVIIVGFVISAVIFGDIPRAEANPLRVVFQGIARLFRGAPARRPIFPTPRPGLPGYGQPSTMARLFLEEFQYTAALARTRRQHILRSIDSAPVEIETAYVVGRTPSLDALILSEAQLVTVEAQYTRQIASLADELLGSVATRAFRTRAELEQALRTALNARAPGASWTFEVANGRLTFPSLGQIGAVEIKGGSINAYAWTTGLAGIVACGSTECVDELLERLVPHGSDETISRAEADEIRLRNSDIYQGSRVPTGDVLGTPFLTDDWIHLQSPRSPLFGLISPEVGEAP